MGREAVQECMEILQSLDTIFLDITEKGIVKKLCKFPDNYIGKFMESSMQVSNEDSSVPIEKDIGESVENLNFHTDTNIGKLSSTKELNTLVTPSKLPKTSSYVDVSKKKERKRKGMKEKTHSNSSTKKRKEKTKKNVFDNLFD